jgi:hypothetical protein
LPPPPAGVVRELHVSRGDVRQPLLLQGQDGHKPPQPSVLALKMLHLPRLIDVKAALECLTKLPVTGRAPFDRDGAAGVL